MFNAFTHFSTVVFFVYLHQNEQIDFMAYKPIVAHRISIRSFRGKPSRKVVVREWKRLPRGVFPFDDGMRIEIHYNNGEGFDGKPVRIRRKWGWQYLTGTTKGPRGVRWDKRFGVNGKLQTLARLVLFAFAGLPKGDATKACHITPIPIESFGDNSCANLVWGTTLENNCDIDRNGCTTAKSRSFFGQKEDDALDDTWEEFPTQRNAANITGLSRRTITRALDDGNWRADKNGCRWRFKYISTMILEQDEGISFVSDEPEERRFITTLGRYGERIRNSNTGEDALYEIKLKKGHGGYKRVTVRGVQKKLHRLMIERFLPDEITKKMTETGLSWEYGELEVDHVEDDQYSETYDDSLANLKIVTIQEHRDKHARAVVEIDATDGNRIPGRSWISAAEAGRKTKLRQTGITAVCRGGQNSTGGRRFLFVDELPDPRERAAAFKESMYNAYFR